MLCFCSCRTSSFATWVTGAKTLRTSLTGRRCLTVKGAAQDRSSGSGACWLQSSVPKPEPMGWIPATEVCGEGVEKVLTWMLTEDKPREGASAAVWLWEKTLQLGFLQAMECRDVFLLIVLMLMMRNKKPKVNKPAFCSETSDPTANALVRPPMVFTASNTHIFLF